MVDLKKQYSRLQSEIEKGVLEVLSSGAFIGGPFVKEFEDKMKSYLGTNHAIACANGTDALMIAMMALDIKPGDEVITTPFTFVATAETIALLGAKPVYVDIDEQTYNIDPNKIEEKITDKTKAIIPVHIWGQSADMGPIMEIAKKHNIPVIEDNAQGVGASYGDQKCGTIGDLATISFYPAKNLGAYGDAGMIIAKTEELEQKVRMICNHGSSTRYFHEVLGVNSRLDAIQAKILSIKLDILEEENENRRQFAEMYNSKLSHDKIQVPYYANYGTAIVHQYGILVDDRDGLIEHLKSKSIPNAIHYPIPLHLQPAFKDADFPEGVMPISERVASKVVNLPIHPYMDEEQIDYICQAILEFVN
jgi:UDP-2-acetamido-2-deoxy-ribo-hexuluronate aminotransferase